LLATSARLQLKEDNTMTQRDADKLKEQIKTLTTEQLALLRAWIINEHFNRLHEEAQGKQNDK
jgi:hypothetical protein